MGNNKNRTKITNIRIKTGDLLKLGGIKKIERGKQYLDDGRVLALEFPGADTVKASILGGKKYSVSISGGDEPRFRCSCPSFENEGFCKHCVAVLLAAEQGTSFETINENYVSRLIGGINKIEDKVKPNPGDEIAQALNEMGAAETGAVGAHGEYRYRQTEKGLVVWGGSAAKTLLRKFDLLRMKDGFRIDGYYFYDGMGGNFRPVAMPADMDLPDWTDDSRNPVFEPEAIPDGIDTEIDSYVVHDHTPKSYFQKSIFLRELDDIGAFWHGCSDWHIKGIVLEKSEVLQAIKSEKYDFTELKNTPELLLPKISYPANGSIEVTFYFLSGGLGSTRGLFRLTDIHQTGGMVKFGKRECIIDMGPGPIP
ncbi:MAG TPA: SWIM zinc finger family protein [bacterium]|nr:SWIM zinc finger family protein [bacterium]